jgi:hypothetical protein
MKRRELLMMRMDELESQGMACHGCSGTCCTFEANSMLVTPGEGLEIFTYLKDQNRLTEILRLKLQDCITHYRLLPKFDQSGRSYLRKSYTCPFFHHHELGCSLPKTIKPYGCLAFNSHHKEMKAKEFCFSEINSLSEDETNRREEQEENTQIKKRLNLNWEKSPIPNAVLEFWN